MNTVYAWILAVFSALWPGAADEAGKTYFGYVEGEYVYVAAKQSGILETLSVTRGDTVRTGAQLFTLDSDQQRIALGEAQADLMMAQATLLDESTGKRPEEIQVIEEQLRSAEASFALAKADYERYRELSVNDFVSPSQLDQAAATLDEAAASVGEQRANLAVARLPARSAQLDEARQSVKAKELAADKARIDLEDRLLASPSDGYVQQTYYLPGEYVAAGRPVVSILPPDEIKFRFYIGEPDRAGMTIGTEVLIGCDSCIEPIKARIVYISSSAEYTPPVIYSLEDRSKLVFMAEALPDEPTALLPGQPIDVRPSNDR
ncbi:HlyD family secretion protein [Hoeflea prorocentri]|uniref:HlyD family efflux transporter periplasmic adaptor subunit n=1 Tax=Hoeflea prorocentri TaxID=1922333 RepID=A0A9X3UQD9_9HYPH|nr:HlyD family efflux transporter periplasmic adaptor subunit [Hoeflea prorocentri]MCY6383286.1 HlyD family efflux transporter periplasmic adaptor subunit [Hoeflea prorocentri]MDA5401086.1 HlyD family efflux transporter periplasmic adaptor subunit [Hoeflea prorocentri]